MLGETKIRQKGKLSGNTWCKTNDGKNCDGNVYSVQVMQQTMSSGPKTFLQALKESGKTLQLFYDQNNDKYKFGPNTGAYENQPISGLYIDRVDGNTIYFYQQPKNGKRQDLNPINMNDIILKTSGGGKRRRKSRKSLFKKKRTKKRKRRRKRKSKRKSPKRKRKTRRRRK